MRRLLREGLEKNDLKRLVHSELHIDEYQSKMGRDSDICVLSFKITGKPPATDLVSFVEKGYDWVIDADVSSGEMPDGDYIVFVEIERSPKLPEQIMKIAKDVMNLTDQSIDEWRVRYHKSTEDYDLSAESLRKLIPLTREQYRKEYGSEELDKMRAVAGVPITTKAPRNDLTDSLRRAAGIL